MPERAATHVNTPRRDVGNEGAPQSYRIIFSASMTTPAGLEGYLNIVKTIATFSLAVVRVPQGATRE